MMSISEPEAFTLSNHAAARMAQRGIRGAILDLVLVHGTRARAQRGCEEYILSERAARHLEAAGYNGETIAAATKIRAIVDAEGRIVTCYHQRKGRLRPSGRKFHLRGVRHA